MSTYKTLLTEVRTLKKVANDDFKENLLELLNSEDLSQVNQALSLNDALNILSDQEVADILIPKTHDNGFYRLVYWENMDSFGWELLKKYPNHPEWKQLDTLVSIGEGTGSVPKEIENLTNLTELSLRKANVPKEIGNLTNLKDLTLSSCNLTSLPSWIGNLKNLTYLGLYSNNLSTLPKEIGNLTNLDALGLDFNKLTSLPKEIGNLTNLEKLWLNGNKLTSLPEELGKLRRSLKVVELYNNYIKKDELPNWLKRIVSM